MDEQNQKSTVIDKELEIEDMREFLLENQGIKLENLPTYEDLIKPEVKQEVKLDNLQEVNTLPFFETKQKPKVQPKPDKKGQKRFKITASCFAVVGVLLLSLVMINGVSLALLNKETSDNKKTINSLTQEVTDLEKELELKTPTGEGEKLGYKLALPRNYPDDTSELTWFDKLSIFLMKLFG